MKQLCLLVVIVSLVNACGGKSSSTSANEPSEASSPSADFKPNIVKAQLLKCGANDPTPLTSISLSDLGTGGVKMMSISFSGGTPKAGQRYLLSSPRNRFVMGKTDGINFSLYYGDSPAHDSAAAASLSFNSIESTGSSEIWFNYEVQLVSGKILRGSMNTNVVPTVQNCNP